MTIRAEYGNLLRIIDQGKGDNVKKRCYFPRCILRIWAVVLFLIPILAEPFGQPLVHAAPLSLSQLQARLATYRTKIQQQTKNIADMKAELQQAAQQRRIPNVGKLHQYATASGQRTQAYYNEPDYIRKLIEQIEKDPVLIARHSAILAAGVPTGQYGISRAHYLVEIDSACKVLPGSKTHFVVACLLVLI